MYSSRVQDKTNQKQGIKLLASVIGRSFEHRQWHRLLVLNNPSFVVEWPSQREFASWSFRRHGVHITAYMYTDRKSALQRIANISLSM